MAKLKDITNIISGYSFRSKIDYDVFGGTNLLNMEAISSTGCVNLTIDDTKKISVTNIKAEEILTAGDIIFKAKGLNNNAVILCNVPPDTIVTASCLIIRVTSPLVIPEYVTLFLNSKAAKNHFAKSSGQATGLMIANVGKATLGDLDIIIPPLKEQRLLADIEELHKQEQKILSKIVEKKEILNRKIIEKELQKYY